MCERSSHVDQGACGWTEKKEIKVHLTFTFGIVKRISLLRGPFQEELESYTEM